MSKTIKARVSNLAFTAAEWLTKNPVLLKGEIGVETDTNKMKVGDGTSTWKQLKYVVDMQEIESSFTYQNETAMLIDVGGYKKGKSFADAVSLKAMFDGLLYPYVAPSVSATADVNGGTYEYGITKTISKVTANVTKGARNIKSVTLKNGSTVIESKTGDAVKNGGSIVFTLADPIAVSGTNTRLTVEVVDEKITGDPSATYTASTGSFTWLYPFFRGVTANEASAMDAAAIIAGTKDVSAKGQKSYSYTTNNNKAFIAYPKSYGVLKKVTDGSGVTDYTNSFGTPSTVSVTSTNPAWGPVDYYVYCSGNATVTNFQYKFNF